jgi:hypothetical protein
MDVLAAYREVGSYRGAAVICGTTHKTVRRIVEAHEASSAGQVRPQRKDRGRNYDSVADLVARKVTASQGRISAKRLLPAARTAGYVGSARNWQHKGARDQPAGPALIVATNVDQQGARRLRGEGLGRPGTMRKHAPGLNQQIVHGHPHPAFPCLSV